MSDFIKKFKSIWEYRNAYSGLPQPNIVYVENDGIIDFNPEDRIVIRTYLSSSQSTVSLVSMSGYFDEIEVDGVKYNPADCVNFGAMDAGEHVIKYKYNTDSAFTTSSFGGLSYVTSMVIPEGVKAVSNFLPYFNSNTNGNNLVFPESVESIVGDVNLAGSGAGYITCKAKTPPTLQQGMHFSGAGTLFVPAESVNLYTASDWSFHFNTILPIEPSAL